MLKKLIDNVAKRYLQILKWENHIDKTLSGFIFEKLEMYPDLHRQAIKEIEMLRK
jgi:hypothetical protein